MKNLYLIFSLLAACSAAPAQTSLAVNRGARNHQRPHVDSAASTALYVSFPTAGTADQSGYAGDGTAAIGAQLAGPMTIATDAQGDLYIYDSQNNVVREVTAATGIIQTVAGNQALGAGYSGDGGPAISAQIGAAQGLAVDAAGNLYIADGPNARVRMVDATGNITTFAGNGSYGYAGDGGLATSATLDYPVGIAVDPSGNVFIADFGSATVREVSAATGIISTVAGVGTAGLQNFLGEGGLATQAFLGEPYDVAVDGSGNLFILDLGSSTIQKVGTNGIINTFVSNVSSASVATDPAGNLYFSDYRNNVVNKVLPDGTVIPIAGVNGTIGYYGDGGSALQAEYNGPYGIALDASANVYVADYGNDVVRQLYPVPAPSVIVANGASDLAYSAPGVPLPLAPGEVVTIFGNNIGFSVQATNQPDGNGIFESNFAYTTVTFNGIPAPILISGPTYVSAVVPYELSGSGNIAVNVVVSLFGQPTATATVPYSDSPSPGAFTLLSTGVLNGLPVLNADGGVNPLNAATANSTISVFVTGEGQTLPAGIDGLVTGSSNMPTPLQPVSVTIGGQTATVVSATEAPGQVAGVMQVMVTLPASVTASFAVPVQVTVGNVASQLTYISVE